MSLFIASLNSGSNGNCYYIGNEDEAILIDAGISCREIEKRVVRLGLSIHKIKAIFVSHEHSDHISGISVLSKKYKLPVYITDATLLHGRIDLEKHLIRSFRAGQCVDIGNLLITPFPKLHDAIEPLSFAIACKGINIGVFTDIGTPCKDVINQFKRCHAAFLEANYDDTMLDNGSYPHHLKNRIRGGKGHLSNKQALDLFIQHRPSFMTHLFLSHLSKNNNCTELVYQLFHANAAGVKIIVASRYEETSLYSIAGVSNKIYPAIKRTRGLASTVQLSFAFQ